MRYVWAVILILIALEGCRAVSMGHSQNRDIDVLDAAVPHCIPSPKGEHSQLHPGNKPVKEELETPTLRPPHSSGTAASPPAALLPPCTPPRTFPGLSLSVFDSCLLVFAMLTPPP